MLPAMCTQLPCMNIELKIPSYHGRTWGTSEAGWTQGPVLLQALGMLEAFDLRAMGHNSARYIHVVTEALKLCFADRERYYGDGENVPITELLAPAYARERAALIRMDRAAPEAPPPGDPRRRGGAPPGAAVRTGGAGAAVPAADGTTHIAAIDRDGNMICLTSSGGVFRKSAFMPELGCTLSTRSEMFVLEDDHPNALAPGRRPRTTLVSYVICEGGVPTTTIGCPGGDDQAQAADQVTRCGPPAGVTLGSAGVHEADVLSPALPEVPAVSPATEPLVIDLRWASPSARAIGTRNTRESSARRAARGCFDRAERSARAGSQVKMMCGHRVGAVCNGGLRP